MVARMAGITVPYILQHTLQISPFLHLYDPHFTGLLLHSCNPLVTLDMNKLEVWALQDIEKGDALTMDYAQTEDKLFKQFPCSCGAINCRKWVTRITSYNVCYTKLLRYHGDSEKKGPQIPPCPYP